MKFLLVAINAKYIHSNPAVYSLYAYSEKQYAQFIELVEYTINQRREDILAGIYEKKPDAIGFSCYIWNWKMIEELLPDIFKVLSDTDVWLGGPQVSYNAGEILKKFPNIKGIMIGEGEETFFELLGRYRKEETEDLSSISGLYLKSGFTQKREITDLNRLPFLYHKTEPFINRIIYYESSRGCPFGCSYCLSSVDKTVRYRDMGLVKKELDFFLSQGVSQVKFVDRTFNCSHERAMAIWQYLYEHDNGITNFHFEISADLLNDEEIELLKKLRPGQVQLEIGVQSVNEKTLEAINRRMDIERLEHAVYEIRRNGNIHQHLDLIVGLPYEDYESFGRSFDRVYAMRPDQLQVGFLKVLKGTPIFARTKEFGIAFTEEPPYEVLFTGWLSYPEVIRLKKIEEMTELYYNSNQFMNTLEYLLMAFPTPFKMFEALAGYYEEKGCFTNSPSRTYRYEVLFEFSETFDPGKREIYKELLTYDLYLRENLKSRPEFCKTLSNAAYKTFRNDFYKEEEKNRYYLPKLQKYDSRQLGGFTHIEPFKYPVWDIKKLSEYSCEGAESTPCLHEETYVLFDYTNKNPLTKEAKTTVIGGSL